MGRRAYVTQMALGRSAFQPLPENLEDEGPTPNLVGESSLDRRPTENASSNMEISSGSQDHMVRAVLEDSPLVRTSGYEQQYDNRGYPQNAASSELTRQSRRAMNDVLATVGVCVGVDRHGQKMTINDRSRPSFDREKIDSITMENEMGLILDSVDMMLVSLASMIAVGFRQRLQTFRFDTGISVTAIGRSEWRHIGSLEFLLAGAPAGLLYRALNITSSWAIETLSVGMLVRLYENVKSPKHRNVTLWVLEVAERLLYGASSVLLAPLQMYATLQRLNLLPGWPWLPSPKAFVPFSETSPLQMSALPNPLTFSSSLAFSASLTVSPIFLWCVMGWTKPRISSKLRAYIRAALPKPHYPDRYSLQAAKEDELDNDSIPGLCNDPDGDKSEWESASFSEELAKDLRYIGKNFAIIYDSCVELVSRQPEGPVESIRPQPSLERIEIQDIQADEAMGTFSVPSPSSSSTPSSAWFPLRILSPPPTSSHPSTETTTSPTGSGPLFPDSHLSPRNENEEPLFSNNIANSPTHSEPDTQPDNETKPTQHDRHHPTHRITALSAYAADALANHLAAHVADIIFLPLEALFVRSLALAFLSSPRANPAAQAAAARWRGEVFPLGGWCGMGLRGGWRGVGDYVGKMMLVVGMEMGVSMVVWQGCTGFAWMSGRRWFGWGTH